MDIFCFNASFSGSKVNKESKGSKGSKGIEAGVLFLKNQNLGQIGQK
jgi:hypothetical protein